MSFLTAKKILRVAFAGPMQSGKTTGAKYVSKAITLNPCPESRGIRGKVLSFAEGVKLAAFDVVPPPTIPFARFTAEEKIAYVNEYKHYYRERLQTIGEALRKTNPNHWIDLLHLRACVAEDAGVPTLVIDDVRYLNEAEYCRKQGYVLIKIIPNKLEVTDDLHPSENQWFDIDPDFTICHRMDRPIATYYSQIDSILKQIV